MNLSIKRASLFITAIIAILLVFGFDPASIKIAEAKTIIISGEITQIDWGMWTPSGRRRAVLHVKTAKGNLYQIHVGMRTEYVPHQTPEVGNKVSCTVEKVRGVWAAYRVTYK